MRAVLSARRGIPTYLAAFTQIATINDAQGIAPQYDRRGGWLTDMHPELWLDVAKVLRLARGCTKRREKWAWKQENLIDTFRSVCRAG